MPAVNAAYIALQQSTNKKAKICYAVQKATGFSALFESFMIVFIVCFFVSSVKGEEGDEGCQEATSCCVGVFGRRPEPTTECRGHEDVAVFVSLWSGYAGLKGKLEEGKGMAELAEPVRFELACDAGRHAVEIADEAGAAAGGPRSLRFDAGQLRSGGHCSLTETESVRFDCGHPFRVKLTACPGDGSPCRRANRVLTDEGTAARVSPAFGCLVRRKGIAILLGNNYDDDEAKREGLGKLHSGESNVRAFEAALRASPDVDWDLHEFVGPCPETLLGMIDTVARYKRNTLDAADHVLFYYFGHGGMNANGEDEMAPKAGERVTLQEVARRLHGLAAGAGSLVVVPDCCRGGENVRPGREGAKEVTLDMSGGGPGTVIVYPVQSTMTQKTKVGFRGGRAGPSDYLVSLLKAMRSSTLPEVASRLSKDMKREAVSFTIGELPEQRLF